MNADIDCTSGKLDIQYNFSNYQFLNDQYALFYLQFYGLITNSDTINYKISYVTLYSKFQSNWIYVYPVQVKNPSTRIFPYTGCLVSDSAIGQASILREKVNRKERIKFCHLSSYR